MLDINHAKLKEVDIDSLINAYLFLTSSETDKAAEKLDIPIQEGIEAVVNELNSRPSHELVEYILSEYY